MKSRRASPPPLPSQAIAIYIEEELQLMPWTLTSNFQAYKHGKCMLALRGVADPSGCGAAHAYTKLALRERLAEEEEEALRAKPKASGPKQLVGTDSDLRKLRKEDCIAWLAPHGYTREQVLCSQIWCYALSSSLLVTWARPISTYTYSLLLTH